MYSVFIYVRVRPLSLYMDNTVTELGPKRGLSPVKATILFML